MSSRERPYDFMLDGVGYVAARDERGVPIWKGSPVPRIAGEQTQTAEESRVYQSWHGGFGYSHFLLPNTFNYALGCDTSRPRALTMGPLVTTFAALGAVTGFFEQGSSFYVLDSRYCQKIDVSDDECETPNAGGNGKDFGSGAVCTDGIPFDSSTRVLFSSATDAWSFDGTDWTQATNNNIQGVYGDTFWSESATAYVLFLTFTSSGDPAIKWLSRGSTFDSTSWGAVYIIGDGTKPITGAKAGKTAIWIGKKDGLYYFDGRSGRTPKVLDAWPSGDDNGKNLFVDSEGQVWYSTAAALYRYNPNTGGAVDVTPGRGAGHTAPIYGRATAICQYREWYYVSMDNGTDSYIMVGREREEGEPGFGSFIWHGALAKVTGDSVSAMYVLGQTSPPRLYWGAGSNVSYIRLGDSSPRYAASGSLYFPADNFGLTGNKWNLMGIICECDGFNTSTYGDWFGSIDGNAYQAINRLQGSGRVFIPIPTGNWLFANIAFRLDVTNASSTTTPTLRGVTFLATRRVYSRMLLQTVAICSERVLTRQHIQSRMTGQGLYDHLDRLSVRGPVTLKDWWTGRERTQRVLVQPVQQQVVRVPGGKDDEVELAASLAMLALASETVKTETSTVGVWDSGLTWDSGRKWG